MQDNRCINIRRDLKTRLFCKHHAYFQHEFEVITVELDDSGKHNFRIICPPLDLAIECNLPSLSSFRLEAKRTPKSISNSSHDTLKDLGDYFTSLSLLMACELLTIEALREHYICLKARYGRFLSEVVIQALETLRSNLNIERVNIPKQDTLNKSLSYMEKIYGSLAQGHQSPLAGFTVITVDENGVASAEGVPPDQLLDILTGKGFKI